MMKSKLLVETVQVLAMVTIACGADMGTKSGFQWLPYLQWDIENPTYSENPFDIVATVTFTHQKSGGIHITEMFYDGQATWKFRFTGTKVGVWTFATSSADSDLSGHTGTVKIRPNPHDNAHGFLRKFKNKWGWQGSEDAFVPQLVMWDYIAGNSSPKLFYNNPALIDEMLHKFLLNHGFNGFHLPVIAGRWFNFDATTDEVTSSMSDPDLRTFEALELLIKKTHAAGGLVHIWTWGDHQRLQTARSLAGGIGGSVDKRLQRYIAARLGPIPGWSMGYGFDLDEWVEAGQLETWCKFMHQQMGWFHFLGGRPAGPNCGTDHSIYIPWNQVLDYSSFEHHRPTYDVYVAAIEALPEQPAMSEDRFRVRNNPSYTNKDYTEELTRQGLYHSTMAGGVANIWGQGLSDGGVYSNKEQLKAYSIFFFDKKRFLPDMRRANELSRDGSVWVLFSPSTQSYVLYRENTNVIQIDLSEMSAPAPALAVNTKSSYAEIGLGTLRPQHQTITLPSFSDWIVAIGTFSHTAPAQPELSFMNIWNGPTLKGGHGAMWADVDDDGFPDLYLPLIDSGTLPDLFMYNQAGTFIEQGALRGIADEDGGTHGAVWCDLDNDGDYDLVNGTTSVYGTDKQNDVFRNDGKGYFTEVKPASIEARQEMTRAIISFDMEGDGDLDIFAVSNYEGSADPPEERNEIYRNEGNFNFTSITSGDLYSCPAGQGATDTDYDGDGDIDVFAANRTGPLNILQNNGKGDFTRMDPSSIGIRHKAEDGITTADVDNDGDIDLLLAGSSGEGYLYLNKGGGTFSYKQSFSDIDGYMGGFTDLDNDGDLDIYFAGDTKVYLNDGSGYFKKGPSVPVEGKNDPRGVAFADLDNDGDMDFAFGTKRAARNFIIRNELLNGGNWLKVKLIGPNGQAGAFGAKTYIYPAGRIGGTLLGIRESKSNNGYLGQDDPVLHFGLGLRSSVDVVVKFLDGTIITKSEVAANQSIVVDGREQSNIQK